MGLAGSNAWLIFCGNKRLCTDPTNLTTWPEAKKGEKTRKQTRKQCWSLVTNNALGWTTMRLSSLRGVAFMGRLPYSRRSWMRFPMWYRHVLETEQNTQLHRWSKQPRIQAKGKDEIFVHCRTVYLRCPDSFEEDLKRYYVALILYNIAVCFHMLSLIGERNPCSFGDFSSKAFSIYNMAFATKKLSLFKDGVLLTVLFNNSGQLLYRQGRTFEATKRLGLVQELISTLPMNSFAPDDYDGMFLNSLMDSDTASAAWRRKAGRAKHNIAVP